MITPLASSTSALAALMFPGAQGGLYGYGGITGLAPGSQISTEMLQFGNAYQAARRPNIALDQGALGRLFGRRQVMSLKDYRVAQGENYLRNLELGKIKVDTGDQAAMAKVSAMQDAAAGVTPSGKAISNQSPYAALKGGGLKGALAQSVAMAF
jgi:hypothetical protein